MQTIYQPILFPPERDAVRIALKKAIHQESAGPTRDQLHYALAAIEGAPRLPYSAAETRKSHGTMGSFQDKS